MEARIMGWCVLALGMLGFVASTMVSSNDLTCLEALSYVKPCGSFLGGSGAVTPPLECCLGLKKLVNEATTTPIRRHLCRCFKLFVGALGDDLSRLQSIPKLCQVSLPMPLDPNIDCSSVQS